MSENQPEARVQLGCCIEIELLSHSGGHERLAFDLVADEQADYQAGFLGVNTPLAQGILGEKAGITVPYFTEDLQGVQILSVAPSTRKADVNAAARREATVQDAVEQIEFTNAVLFAASTDTKWGEYDADGLDFEGWKMHRARGDDKSESNQT